MTGGPESGVSRRGDGQPGGSRERVERVVVITGAARGIGAATARRLAAEGYGVVALDSCAGTTGPTPYALASPEELQRLAEEGGGRIEPVFGDVRDPAVLGLAVDTALRRWGRLDAAVAAAAVMLGGRPQWETPVAELTELWEVDLLGVWHTAQAVLPVLLAQPAPANCRFVAVASAAGEHGLFALTAYSVVKHAVVGLVRGLAADLAGTGVTAVAVSPGSTDTAMLQETARLYGVDVAELAARQRIGRPLAPAEIAETIALCCSPAGAGLNGSVVRVDGGFGG